MAGEFASRTALVTGAGSGIGAAVAALLGSEGADVVVCDRDEMSARATADLIRSTGGSALVHVGDVTDPADVEASVRYAVEEFGALHLAFNNAGIGGPRGLVGAIDLEAYRALIDVNLHSVFYALHFEIPAMLEAGGGAIVNTSSVLGLVGNLTSAPYVAAKHGVTGLTKAAAAGHASDGIRVNSVHPGYIDTPLLRRTLNEDEHRALIAKHPMGRFGKAREVAELVVFLLSDRASFITGSQHAVDGGYTAI